MFGDTPPARNKASGLCLVSFLNVDKCCNISDLSISKNHLLQNFHVEVSISGLLYCFQFFMKTSLLTQI